MRPPRLGERLLERLIPEGAARQGALGDLYELHLERARTAGRAHAALWYWSQVLGIGARYTWERLRRARTGPPAPAGKTRRGGGLMTGFGLDLRHARRALRRAPGFAAVAVLTLALGIGGTVAIFSVLRAVVLRDLPYPDAGRVVVIWENDRLRGTTREGASAPDFRDFVERTSSFERLAGRSRASKTLGGEGEAVRLRVSRVTASYFPMLRVEPLLGRGFFAEEEEPGRERVALLSEGLWKGRFGADPGVVGATVRLDGEPVTVVGVMPRHAELPFSNEELWQPLALTPYERDIRGIHSMLAFGRLAPGVPLAQAQQEMSALMRALEEQYPEDNRGRGAELVALPEQTFGAVRPALVVLMAAVCLVLLVACANVANLLLARGVSRAKELAVRSSLGASGWQLGRLVLAESLALAGAGGAAGVLLAWGGVRLVVHYGPSGVPRLEQASVDTAALGFAVALTLTTGLLFGLLPAWRAARARPATALGHVGRSSSVAGGGARPALVVAEVALAAILVVGSGLLIKSLWRLQQVDSGYRVDGLLLADLTLSGPRYPFPEGWPVHAWPELDAFTAALKPRVERLPGVVSAALAHAGPADPGWTTRVVVDGRPAPVPGHEDEAGFRPVDHDYFATAGVRILDGRGFDRFDTGRRPLVAVVNEAFVRRHFPGRRSPVGERILIVGAPREIVGVAADVRFAGLESAPQPAMYLPLAQNPQGALTLLVRTEGDPRALAAPLRHELAAVDPGLALFDVQSADAAIDTSLSQRRFNTGALLLFAAIALVLATVGVYGVLAYGVAQRTQEIGVRMALGAAPGQLVRLVVGQGMSLVVIALALGFAGSLASGRLLESLLYGVEATDPATFAAVAAVLAATALVACYLPARRATRIDPNAALRVQ